MQSQQRWKRRRGQLKKCQKSLRINWIQPSSQLKARDYKRFQDPTKTTLPSFVARKVARETAPPKEIANALRGKKETTAKKIMSVTLEWVRHANIMANARKTTARFNALAIRHTEVNSVNFRPTKMASHAKMINRNWPK